MDWYYRDGDKQVEPMPDKGIRRPCVVSGLTKRVLRVLCAGILGTALSAHAAETTSGAMSLDEVIGDLANCVQRSLEQRQIKKLAVTRIYFNGSGTAPVAKYIQRRVVGSLLNATGSDLEVMERQDLRLMVEENALQWMTEGKTEPGFAASHALLTGEILWDRGFGQALLSMRVIDTRTGQLIAAPCRVTTLSPDLRERLGVPGTEPPGADMFIAKPSVDLAAGDLTAKLAGMKTKVSLAGPDSVPEKYRFPYRVLSAMLVDHFASRGLLLLERELLFQASGEQAAAQEELNTVLLGDIVLQVELDESTGIDSPVFFARAVRRQDGRLLGQSEFRLVRMAKPLRTSDTPTARMGTPGADEALTDVIAAHRRASELRSTDSLVFAESFRLSTDMQADDGTIRLLGSVSQNETRNRTVLRVFSPSSNWQNAPHCFATDCVRDTLNGRTVLDRHIEVMLKDPQYQNVDKLKTWLVATSAIGFCVDEDEERFFPGPLNLLACRIAQQLTVASDGSLCPQYWCDVIADFQNEKSFAWQWISTMDPTIRRTASRGIDPVKGTVQAADRSTLPHATFNYIVKTDWSGKYPSEVTITIDLTPMKDRLKRVKLTN